MKPQKAFFVPVTSCPGFIYQTAGKLPPPYRVTARFIPRLPFPA